MLFWGLKKRDLQIRIFGFSLLVHVILVGGMYTFFMYNNSRVLSFGSRRRVAKGSRRVRFTLAKVRSMVASRGEATQQIVSVNPALPRPVEAQRPQKLAKVPVLPAKKVSAKAVQESSKSAVYKIYTKLALGAPKEEVSNYTKLEKEASRLLAKPDEKEEIKPAKKPEEKQVLEAPAKVADPEKPLEPIMQPKIEQVSISVVQASPEEVIAGEQGDTTGELIIDADAPVTGELAQWELELVIAIKKQLVFPAGFADREELSITVFLDLHGKVTTVKEEGCDIPALRALVRKFFKNFEYPAEMRGKQRTFKIV